MLASLEVFQYPYGMDSDGLTTYIIHHISEGDDPNDLIFDIYRKTDPRQPARDARCVVVLLDRE